MPKCSTSSPINGDWGLRPFVKKDLIVRQLEQFELNSKQLNFVHLLETESTYTFFSSSLNVEGFLYFYMCSQELFRFFSKSSNVDALSTNLSGVFLAED